MTRRKFRKAPRSCTVEGFSCKVRAEQHPCPNARPYWWLVLRTFTTTKHASYEQEACSLPVAKARELFEAGLRMCDELERHIKDGDEPR